MIHSQIFLFSFFILCGMGLVMGIFLSEGQIPSLIAVVGGVASIFLMGACATMLLDGRTVEIPLLNLPVLGSILLRIDPLSTLFAFVAGMVFLPVSIYSSGYLVKYLKHYSLRWFSLLYFPLLASIVLVFISGDVLSFLLSWEAMSILSYLLVNYEHESGETTRSGFLMLAMSEMGTLAVIGAFFLLASRSGSLDFVLLKSSALALPEAARLLIFFLTFFGFGVKAGLFPVNAWLPRAHPVAPANVSAILSAVILNLGIYGIFRVNADLVPVASVIPGVVAFVMGSVSALVGILYATTENDMKKMLAHSSIENMGIVTAGLGAGFIFRAFGNLPLAGIAFVAALYHMTNHSLYKSLLFLGAGSVDTRTGTRNMDKLGGLMKFMPWTGALFLVGALSISAIPPFNGFVSEWLTLQTLLQSAALSSTGIKVIFALCGSILALTAALAITCFVKAFSMSFLGMPRSDAARKAGASAFSMRASMGILAILCLVFGILPTSVISALDKTISFTNARAVEQLVPPFFKATPQNQLLPPAFVSDFHNLGAQVGSGILPGPGFVVMHRGGATNPVVFAMSTFYMFLILLLFLIATALLVRWFTFKRSAEIRGCWDGGIRKYAPWMTYSATGFSNPVRVVFQGIFKPLFLEEIEEESSFKTAVKKERVEIHVVERWFHLPVRSFLERMSAGLESSLHGKKINAGAAYIFFTLLIFIVAALFH